jgi:hypothetical protein
MSDLSCSLQLGNARSGGPFIESAHDLHELASQQDERAPQYEGDAIEMLARTVKSDIRIFTMAYAFIEK